MRHLGTKLIETKRLILRKFKEKDAKEIFNGFINQEEFLYYANKNKVTLEEEINSLKNIDDRYNNLEYYNWLIPLKDNTIIGAINIMFLIIMNLLSLIML